MGKANFKSIVMKQILFALVIMGLLIMIFSIYQQFNSDLDIKRNLYNSLSSLFFENLEEEINKKMAESSPKILSQFPSTIDNKLKQVAGMSYYSKMKEQKLYIYKYEEDSPVLYKIHIPTLVKKVNKKVELNTSYGIYSTLYNPIFKSGLKISGVEFYQRNKIIRNDLNYYYVSVSDDPYALYPFFLIIDLKINLLKLIIVSFLKVVIFLLLTILISYHLTKSFSEQVSTKITRLSETAYLKGQKAVKGIKSDLEIPVTEVSEIDKIGNTLKYLFKSNYNYAIQIEENNKKIKHTNQSLWSVLILTEKLMSNKISQSTFKNKLRSRTNNLEKDTKRPLKNLIQDITEINKEKQEYLQKNKNLIYKTLNLLGKMSEYRDDDTGAHINRVSKVATLLGKEFLSTEKELTNLKNSSKLHDLGKIAIPDKILLKKGKLSDDEYERMKKHSRAGYNILSKINNPLFEMAANISLMHHERWDGDGYPLKIKKEDIPLESRIVSVCDVFDALKSSRPYKKAFSFERSFKIIQEEKGKQFDPKIVEAFMKKKNEIMSIY